MIPGPDLGPAPALAAVELLELQAVPDRGRGRMLEGAPEEMAKELLAILQQTRLCKFENRGSWRRSAFSSKPATGKSGRRPWASWRRQDRIRKQRSMPFFWNRTRRGAAGCCSSTVRTGSCPSTPEADIASFPEGQAAALGLRCRSFRLDVLIGSSGQTGRDLLARVASLMGAPLVLDCLHVDLAGDRPEVPLFRQDDGRSA